MDIGIAISLNPVVFPAYLTQPNTSLNAIPRIVTREYFQLIRWLNLALGKILIFKRFLLRKDSRIWY